MTGSLSIISTRLTALRAGEPGREFPLWYNTGDNDGWQAVECDAGPGRAIIDRTLMVFSYYKKLSLANKRVYRRSDGIHVITVPDAEALRPLVPRLAAALAREDRERVEKLCRDLAAGILRRLRLPAARVRVLAVRPSADWGELHGLYEPAEGRALAAITLWMRTAKLRRVVAFKAFLRTLLHELCHHLDYELYALPDSFHTEGFYKRESSLFHQLVTDAERP